MGTNNPARFLLATIIAVLPIAALWFLAADVGAIEVSAFNPGAQNYPAAVERLEATSHMLVTVTLATLGASGLLLLRRRSLFIGAAGLALFLCSVFSLYNATKLGYYAALTLAADTGDITRLGALLDNQAAAALVAGMALVAMVFIAGVDSVEHDLQG